MTRSGRVGVGIAIALVVLAVAGPGVAPDPLVQPDMVGGVLLPPSADHLLGTDQYSRDVFARLAHGAGTSLQVAAVAVIVALTLGSIVGMLSGMANAWIGAMIRRVIDLALALPRVVVLLVLLAAIGTLPPLLFAVVIGATGWPAIARLVRGETLRLRNADYVTAARARRATASRHAP